MVEIDFLKETLDKIQELKELRDSTDSRDYQLQYQSQIDILTEFALPHSRLYHWNLEVLSECRDKLIRKLEE